MNMHACAAALIAAVLAGPAPAGDDLEQQRQAYCARGARLDDEERRQIEAIDAKIQQVNRKHLDPVQQKYTQDAMACSDKGDAALKCMQGVLDKLKSQQEAAQKAADAENKPNVAARQAAHDRIEAERAKVPPPAGLQGSEAGGFCG